LPATEEIITIRPLGTLQRRVGPEQRPERLRRNDRADDVDVQLAAELIDREFHDRAGDRDTGIVDKACERFARQRRADLAAGGQHRGLIGDVER
jgi:hypothetical protein